MDSGDDRSSTAGVGPDWALIPGPASALFDSDERDVFVPIAIGAAFGFGIVNVQAA